LAGGRATVEVISALQSTDRASGGCNAVHEVSDTDDDSGEVTDESVAHPPPTPISESKDVHEEGVQVVDEAEGLESAGTTATAVTAAAAALSAASQSRPPGPASGTW